MRGDTKAIEDYYDRDGNYIRTEIIHSKGNKTYISPVIDGNTRKVELHEPSTILIPDRELKHFNLNNMTEDEMEKVKKHILSFMGLL